MPNEAAEAASVSNEMSGFFDQAYRAMGDTFKVVMKAQEETVKFWSDAVGKVNPANPVSSDLIPTAQKNAEEYLRLMETSYRRNSELVKKALHAPNGNDSAGFEKNAREWLEAYVAAARDNAQDLANTNLRVAQSWTEAFKKGTQQAAQAAQQVSQKVPVGK